MTEARSPESVQTTGHSDDPRSGARTLGRFDVLTPNKMENALPSGQSAIVEQWLDEIGKTYPAAEAPFLREADCFRSPVAHAFRENAAIVVDAVVFGDDWKRATQALGEIVRVRAVQGFRPEEAGAFIEPLKTIARTALQDAPDADRRIDRLVKLAVDLHVACRRRIDEIAAREAARRTWLLERLRVDVTS